MRIIVSKTREKTCQSVIIEWAELIKREKIKRRKKKLENILL